MKVIYKKKSMVDKINAEIYEAKSINKEIDKIILTPDEWKDLHKELRLLYFYTVPNNSAEPYRLGQVAEFKGIPIFVESN